MKYCDAGIISKNKLGVQNYLYLIYLQSIVINPNIPMNLTARKATHAIFSDPKRYVWIRTLFLGGLPTRPVLTLLTATPDDVIVDGGCGDGFLAEQIPFAKYLGIDSDAVSIEHANRRGVPHATFICCNVLDYPYEQYRPSKVILYGLLHHLNDADCIRLLNSLASSVSKWIVTLDPIYTKYHLVNNILCKLDRGQYVRTEAEMLKLLKQTQLAIDQKITHYATTKIAKYALFRLIPDFAKL